MTESHIQRLPFGQDLAPSFLPLTWKKIAAMVEAEDKE
jgi:hypothetical protein